MSCIEVEPSLLALQAFASLLEVVRDLYYMFQLAGNHLNCTISPFHLFYESLMILPTYTMKGSDFLQAESEE